MSANLQISSETAKPYVDYAASLIVSKQSEQTMFELLSYAIRAIGEKESQQNPYSFEWGYARVRNEHFEIGLFDKSGAVSLIFDEIQILAIVGMTPERDLFRELMGVMIKLVPKDNTNFYILLGMMCEYKLFGSKSIRADLTLQMHELSLRMPFAPKKTPQTYIMVDKETGYIKIGKSKNPCFREGTLQSKKPDVKLIAVCHDDVEKILHKAYSTKRVRGEWFNLSKQDVNDIIKLYMFKRVTKI